MEEHQKYYLHDEIVYDDKFKKSIFDIFDYDVPNNNSELSYHLNYCGYFGRYNIIEIKQKRKTEKKYIIKIYLPNSRIYYYWPFMTPYKFDRLESVYKIHKRIPNSIKEVLLLSYDMPYVNSHDIIKKGILHDKIEKSIVMLHQFGIYHGHRCIIKDKDDIWELYNNIKKIKNY